MSTSHLTGQRARVQSSLFTPTTGCTVFSPNDPEEQRTGDCPRCGGSTDSQGRCYDCGLKVGLFLSECNAWTDERRSEPTELEWEQLYEQRRLIRIEGMLGAIPLSETPNLQWQADAPDETLVGLGCPLDFVGEYRIALRNELAQREAVAA